jgi:hypothetical protein
MPQSTLTFPHLLVRNTAEAQPFKQRGQPVKGKPLPPRDREQHAHRLQEQLEEAQRDAQRRREQGEELAAALGISVSDGMYLEFDIAGDQDQVIQRLESDAKGIELITVKPITKPPDIHLRRATVYVPRGKLGYFEQKIKQYLDPELDSKQGHPRNEPLVASIEDIRLATLQSLWTDEETSLPAASKSLWWEVWLRKNDDQALDVFCRVAQTLQMQVDKLILRFPDRCVVLARGTREQMSRSVELLDLIAELRRAKELASTFAEMNPYEQAEWRDELLRRLTPPGADVPAVCLLDTGVNREHPLIAPALDPGDLHTHQPAWQRHDHEGHGTEMAGIALYGDLASVLDSVEPIELRHRLESVKILPPEGENDPRLYGAITMEAVSRAEVQAPKRPRAVCMAVTTTDSRDRGQPSSWSAEVDQLCAGAQDDTRRLLIISAGNTILEGCAQYPDSNATDGIHDPGQAWNAVTVGAYTERVRIDSPHHGGWSPLAKAGALSPSSTTSCIWDTKKWPIKPDIVTEGGNMARAPDGQVDYVDSLQLLTTYFKPLAKSFVVTGDTSAAAAQAARLAAIVHAQYPNYWPETVRGLLVHAAEWTPAMREQFPEGRTGLRSRMQWYGFGVPSLERALWCARNRLTLVAQDALQPYEKKQGNVFGSKEMNLHKLPWPKAVLQELGETPVKLRVTLSYFIEPSPGRRGWNYRHRYASHGLRFDIKTPSESLDAFRHRINEAAKQEDEVAERGRSDSGDWLLGPQLRHRGSLHSDRWMGIAADLAEREFIAVYPVIGWWRERPNLNRGDRLARYALIVSISTPATSVDIYTPVAQQVQALVAAAIAP